MTYVAERSPQSARRLAEPVLERAGSLDTFSERGRIVPELGDPRLRELLIDPFRLMYEVEERQVRIVGFIHQRRLFLAQE